MDKYAKNLYLAGHIIATGFMDKLAEEIATKDKKRKQKTWKGVLFGATPHGKLWRGIGTAGLLAYILGRDGGGPQPLAVLSGWAAKRRRKIIRY